MLGNSYQLNFTFPWSLDSSNDPFEIYQSLISKQPVKHSVFFPIDSESAVLSFSPETFWEEIDGNLLVYPMKGTRPRSNDPDIDKKMREELYLSEKDRAENLMITDLLRSDLGQIAQIGSVEVKEIFQTIPLKSVWQMVTTIRCKIRNHLHFVDLIKAIFPSGSVTGAPKISSMNILANLEKDPRGIYTGAIFRLNPESETIRSQGIVPIRTIQWNKNKGKYFTGSGITVMSKSNEEWKECHDKIQFLKNYSLLETMKGSRYRFFLFMDHLERMKSSAKTLGFSWPNDLEETCKDPIWRSKLPDKLSKVRLLLHQNSTWEFEVSALPEKTKEVILCPKPFLLKGKPLPIHKTTDRGIYSEAQTFFQDLGFEDGILVSDEGCVIESSIRNIFCKINQDWLTPSLAEGGISGVLRNRLLNKNFCRETRITWEKFQKCESILVGNSVRGLQRATLGKPT